MANLPEAAPIPDKPPLYLKGGNLVVASPLDLREACFSVPAVRALRHARPTATLAVVTPEPLAALWKTVAGINHLVVFPEGASAGRVAALLKSCPVRLESSFAWEDGPGARAFAKAGITQRLGYARGGLRKRLTDPLPAESAPGPPVHRVRFYLGLMERMGIPAYRPENFAPPALLPRREPPLVGLAPGSGLGPAFRWGLKGFQAVAESVRAASGAEFVLLSRTAETAEDKEAGSLDQTLGRAVAGDDLMALLTALPHCSVVVANDGGIAHLAAHCGVPVVVLFGPGDPAATRPLGRIHRVLSEYVECSPCGLAACPLRDHRCLGELSPDRVAEAVRELLASGPR